MGAEYADCRIFGDYAPAMNIHRLKPFEISVKNYDGKSLAVMSSFHFIGDR